ncbi:MAG: hypothetical protein G01um10147_812 [Microgenomates group bacterium Gr01-1014_7]|nr:MAG: hypothetical protein G01um10147_812 [Microgenomates group bacterium Gr01-1014_7]
MTEDPISIRAYEIIAKAGEDEQARNRRSLSHMATQEFICGPTFVDVLLKSEFLKRHDIYNSRGLTKDQEREQLVVHAKLAILKILESEGAILRASKLPHREIAVWSSTLAEICEPFGLDALLFDPVTIESAAETMNQFRNAVWLSQENRVTREGLEWSLRKEPYNILIAHQDLTRLLVFEINAVAAKPRILGIPRLPKPYNPLYTIFREDMECPEPTLKMLNLLTI